MEEYIGICGSGRLCWDSFINGNLVPLGCGSFEQSAGKVAGTNWKFNEMSWIILTSFLVENYGEFLLPVMLADIAYPPIKAPYYLDIYYSDRSQAWPTWLSRVLRPFYFLACHITKNTSKFWFWDFVLPMSLVVPSKKVIYRSSTYSSLDRFWLNCRECRDISLKSF